ncbi:LOW QUALITY PROTEIN: zinc finger and BTB domain-containing protein 38 [Myxocyprinus asiaticus]|uniref:LOW QUALITY PROTEIN: zinc finger and BTB domain-containing protein 38 n=1 Tax=Myxocyprinus asiaticus TaxID=70543 RepID=UPI002223929A|nr:LOW QUALITY PROTEIN: zinc finger and BTB domain-containing protein 38 [Myxocyprinus asiaticus]
MRRTRSGVNWPGPHFEFFIMDTRGRITAFPLTDAHLIALTGTGEKTISIMKSSMNKRQMTVVNSSTLGLMDSSHPQAVLSHLSEQRSQGLFCDVIIVVEDVKFRAHRNILAATSGYFRNAFKMPEIYTSNQVLELTDLKSEVFASILNFIYNAKVESSSAEDSRSLVAAGKRLGIPFLEKLLDSERQSSGLQQSQASASQGKSNSQSKLADTCSLKKEPLKPEESDCSKGPRITNAFSITEAGAVNNPYSTLDHRNKVIEALKKVHPPSSSQATSNSPTESEPAHALSEHSYAVSQGQESNDIKEVTQGNDNRTIMPVVVPAKTLVNHRLGPIKKRHILGEGIHPLLNEPAATVPTFASTSVVEKASPTPLSSSQLSSNAAPEIHSSLNLSPPPDLTPPEDAEPPCLSPQNTPSAPSFCCQQCSETFSDFALLTIHMQIHKRFVSHLFCKYCHKKFMHLKRLRNHEQVCVKSLKGPSELETSNKESSRVPVSNGVANPNNTQPDLDIPLNLEPTLTSPLEMPQDQIKGSLKTNGTSRAYKCSVCKRTYVTLSSLKRHENVHLWHRAYPCHYCNKVFALAEYRTKHEIWHTGERRYQCIFCLETFLTYYILKNHQKSFHDIDPQLAVNKKSANGGFKSSVYPIKLYRLLPMKFRKKRYKSYSQTYSEGIEGHEESFNAPLDSCSPHAIFDSTVPNSDVVSGQSLFSMPVTFMATPKMMASEMPRITFDKPCDQNIEFQIPSEIDQPQKQLSTDFNKKSGLPGFDGKGSPLFSYRFKDSSKAIQKNIASSLVTHRNDTSSTEKSTENSTDILPFLNIPSVCSFEGLSRLSELSAAAQTIEDMANQLLQARPESITQDQPPSGKTETYLAKPACPGPSIDNQVLPLCQITVKIGNEAIVRRKIKGSKLFPKKRKRKSWRQESIGQSSPAELSVVSPSLRLRAEVRTSVTEKKSYDTNDPETDKLWRPYYSYKPKKKGKKLRSRRKRMKPVRCYSRPFSPEANEDLRETHFCPDENISAENYEVRKELKHSSQREAFPCHSCKSSFSSQTSLSMHIISCHQPCCRICGKQCAPEDTSSTAGPTAEDSGDFICKSCTEDGSCFSSDVMPHSLSTEKRYRCSYCPQRFLYLATKKSHEKKHLEKSGKGHNCRYCSKVCKTAVLLGVHESKHFKAEVGEDPDMICKMTNSFPTSKDHKGPVKPEPWESTYNCSEIKPKEPMDRETEGSYPTFTNAYNKTSLSYPYAAERSFASISPELKMKTSKKKSILERSTGFGFRGNRQCSLGAVIWGQQD